MLNVTPSLLCSALYSNLCSVCDRAGRPRHIKSEHVTNALRHSATDLLSTTGIDPANVSARSLRPGGAAALLCANVHDTTIKLIGRWQSDAMIRYLRVQATANRENFAQHMPTHGRFTFNPSDLATMGSSATPRELPPDVAAILRPAPTPAALQMPTHHPTLLPWVLCHGNNA